MSIVANFDLVKGKLTLPILNLLETASEAQRMKLNKRILDNEIEELLVIADPHTLGVMRGHYHRELEKRLVGELAKTLTNADTAQIEQAIGAA